MPDTFRGESRPWQSPDDTLRMQELARACWRSDWPAVAYHPGDLDWWTVGDREKPGGLGGVIRLWFDDRSDASELSAWAWHAVALEMDVMVAPAQREGPILGEAVRWFEARLADRAADAPPTDASPRIWVTDHDRPTIDALGSHGYVPEPDAGYLRFTGGMTDLDLDSEEPPDGFMLAALADDDVPSRVDAGHAAFPGSKMTVEKYRFCRTTTLYRQDLDTVLIAPDGRVAAFALGWFDPDLAAVELEPVGVHPDFWRRGLGRTVCRETLRRARDLGARQVMIGAEGDNPGATGLYAALGLSVTSRVIPCSAASPATRDDSDATDS